MGRGKIILRYPATPGPSRPRKCPTRKERFDTQRAADCARDHLMISMTQGNYTIEPCVRCKGLHIEWTGI